MKPEEVKDLPDLITYIRVHAKQIFVRAKIDGKMVTASLADLPDRLRSEKELGFLEKTIVPVRLLTPEESAALRKSDLDDPATSDPKGVSDGGAKPTGGGEQPPSGDVRKS